MKAKTLHTVYVGKGDKAKALPPGEIIDTKSAGIAAADVAALIAGGFLVEVDASPDAPASDPTDPATGD